MAAKEEKEPQELPTPAMLSGEVVNIAGEVWDKWYSEPEQAFQAFLQFRDSGWQKDIDGRLIPVPRNAGRIRCIYGKMAVFRWRVDFQWDARVAAYDAYIGRASEKTVADAVGYARVEVASSLASLARALNLHAAKALADIERSGKPISLDKLARVAADLSRAAEFLCPQKQVTQFQVMPNMAGMSDEELARELTAGETPERPDVQASEHLDVQTPELPRIPLPPDA